MHAILCAGLLAAPLPALADGNTMIVVATYLTGETEWCPAERGIPVRLSVDGPDVRVIDKVKLGTGRYVERRGVERTVLQRDPRKAPGAEEIVANSPIGRFIGEFEICDSLFRSRGSATWSVKRDGSTLAGETGARITLGTLVYGAPYFRPVEIGAEVLKASMENQLLESLGPVEITRTIERKAP
ncbi:MAG: hypothetical protein AAF871_00680 [Pseudomonadota bacterium]